VAAPAEGAGPGAGVPNLALRLEVLPGAEAIVQGLHLDEASRILEAGFGEPVSRSRRSCCFRIGDPGAAGSGLYLKIERDPRPTRFLASLVRRSRCRVEFDGLRHLRRHGVGAVEPLAMGELRRLGFLRAAFLLTREAPGIDLERHHLQGSGPFAGPSRRSALRGLALFLRAVHDSGFRGRDLHPRNILACEDSGNPGQWGFRVLDQPRARLLRLRPGLRADRGRIFDLACLEKHAPSVLRRTERMRFLLDYLGQDRGSGGVRRWAWRIARVADRKRRQRSRKIEALRWLTPRGGV
jgi:hypothetical protein